MNKRNINYELRITNIKQLALLLKVGVVAIFVIYNLIICNSALAATSTPSAKVSPSPVATSSASLAQKINEIKEKAASKAADFLSQVTKKLQNKAFYGTISSIDGDIVKISFQNKDHSISTNEYTAFSSTQKATKKINSLKDFNLGDFVSGLGDSDDKGVLKAKRLVKSTPIATDSSKLVWGQVQKVSGGTITIKLADSTEQIVTSFGKNLIYLGQEEAGLVDVKVGRTVIARGKISANAGLISIYMYIVPQSNGAKPEKATESTKSATESASPSAVPKKR